MALEKTWRWFGATDSVTLDDIRQIGIEGIVTSLHDIPVGEVWAIEKIREVKDEIERHGLRWSVVESLPVSEGIKTHSTDYGRLIDNYRQSLRNLGACGIDTVCYNFMPVLDWARTNLHYRDERGCESMLFDYPVFAAFDIYILNRPDAENDYDEAIRRQAKDINSKLTDAQKEELAHNIIVVTQAFINGTVDGNAPDYKRQFLNYLGTYKNIDRDKLRENLAAFLNDVIPTAEENGINMCIHADDPPFSLLGLPRIASAVDDFLWIVDRHASLSNGITFCVGSLSARSDNDLPEMARKLAPRIHFIHLRNTKTLEGRSFYESGHLAGNVDMFAVVKALLDEQQRRIREGRKDVGMPFRADHGLRILGDFERKANPGYPLYGRMKGVSEIDGMQKAIERMY